jgi:hypothetical protein
MRRLSNPVGDDTKKDDLVVTVRLPNFMIGGDLLDIRTCIFKAPDGIFLPDPERREGTGEVINPKGKFHHKPEREENESAEHYLKRYEEYQTQLDIINQDVPGWVYADLGYREI